MKRLIITLIFLSGYVNISIAEQDSEAFSAAIYHPDPHIHPHEYQSETDRFILSLIYFGCSPKRYSTKLLKDTWLFKIQKNSFKLQAFYRNPGISNLLQSWKKLSNPQLANPRRLLLDKVSDQWMQLETSGMVIHDSHFSAYSLFSISLQPLKPFNIKWLKNNGYRLTISHKDRPDCTIHGYYSKEMLRNDWLNSKIKNLFLSGGFSLPKLKDEKVIEFGSDTLMLLKFSDYFKRKPILKEAITYSIPKKWIAGHQPDHLIAANNLIPVSFQERTKLYKPTYNSNRSRKLTKKIKLPNQLLVNYPKLSIKDEKAVSEALKAMQATTGVKFQRTGHSSLNKDRSAHLSIEFADLDHGKLIQLWEQTDVLEEETGKAESKKGVGMMELRENEMYHHKKSDYFPLWWYRNPMIKKD